MSKLIRRPALRLIVAASALAGAWQAMSIAAADEVVLMDGRVLTGRLGMTPNVAEVPKPATTGLADMVRPILVVNDDLRRYFVSKRLIQDIRPEQGSPYSEKFNIHQRTLPKAQITSVGPIVRVTPFDEFGRRIFTMKTPNGSLDVIQGITEITPVWTKVEGLDYQWDMRIKTSSIPRETLDRILRNHINPRNIEHRKKIARLYLQSKRFTDARKELESIVADFGSDPKVEKELEPTIRMLRQQTADQLLDELRLRREAGQYAFVYQKLKQFPSEGVAGEKLQEVREVIQEYESYQARRKKVLAKFDELLAKVGDTKVRLALRAIRDEIVAELNLTTIDRLAAFERLADDNSMLPEERLSLAVSGWLVGSDQADVKLPVTLSMVEVRDLVRQYLNEPVELNRHQVFAELKTKEAATPRLVALLIAHMKPPADVPEGDPKQPGYFQLEVDSLDAEPIHYLVQLPPEYDPYRRYPTVVTLHGSGTTPAHQIDWWAGGWATPEGGWRAGQASRHGYIVIAPAWAAEHQREYGYSVREHAAVLNCLRDAGRHFSIDTDRVYLSGHSIGGEAAWDIGLAHPDLWAGVIPIVGLANKFINHYHQNAEWVPLYFVFGQLDGRRLIHSARDLDRYLRYGYRTTVAEYIGRGHESFYDEVHEIFDWMGRYKRDFFPKEFNCRTMRPWDNHFWWIELAQMPPQSMVDPSQWPPRSARAVQIEASITGSVIDAKTGAGHTTVWLSPEMVDFDRGAAVRVNGKRAYTRGQSIEPDLFLLVEDVRRRADRQHPFWANIVMPTGDMNVVY